jgi:VIT1/CCC1 family predicted Fe2+/Mn2+ transporter
MTLVRDDIGISTETESKGEREKWIAIYIAVLAVILAVCAMGGSNATKEATLKNIEAANTWAFFQAKNIRRHVLRVQIDELELLVASQPNLPEAAKNAVEANIQRYREQEKGLSSDPASSEGLEELLKKGKSLEAERDLAMKRDPYFDFSQALLQIAIVVASAAMIAGGNFLLVVSGLVGALGVLLMFNGFTLAFATPLIG